jgi:Zn-dependent protease with chaperone function
MQDRYESMLPRLAEYAKRHPGRYHARVVALAMLGYGVLLGTLLLLTAVAVVVIVASFRAGVGQAWKLAVPLLVLIGVLLEAMWIQINPPRGLVLKRTEAPALWAEIERIRKELGAPAPHQVLISDEMNASVQQVPRLGLLGFYRTYLTIGLPLAASLTPDEFRALLAHEYGHVAGKHGRLGVWIYRVQQTWTEVLSELNDQRHPALIVFRAFVRWYAPYYEAYTAVLRRAHEFDADRDAARVAGSGAAASLLCRLGVASRFESDEFWPVVLRGIEERPQAPADVFRRLLDEAPAAAGHPSAPAWLAQRVALETAPWDSHPSLADRLAALGAAPELPAGPARPSGAEAFFGEHAAPLADRLSRRWADTMQYNWRQMHDEHLERTRRLAALEAQHAEQPLPPPQARERILLTMQVHGATVAMPLMRDFLDAEQDDAGVHYLLGQSLLNDGDEAGLRHLERAMTLDRMTTESACEMAAGFLHARGRGGEADAFARRAREHGEVLDRASAERAPERLSPRDRFLPHGLTDQDAQALRTFLSTVRGLKRALLARKQVEQFPETPCFVLVVVPVWRPGEVEDAPNPSDGLAERLFNSLTMPGTLMVATVVDRSGRRLEKAIEEVPGAELYSRAGAARAGVR